MSPSLMFIHHKQKNMKYTDHLLWRIYENITAVVGWGVIITFAWSTGNTFIPHLMPDWPLIGEAFHWLIGSVGWIIKADIIKYRITRDPRDHPFRKWWTFKNLKRHKFIMLKKGSDPSKDADLITTVCPSCDVLHGFEKTDKASRICSHNGCKEIIHAPHR